MLDVIVIGGGLAGLTAATFAARSGARTLLLEANAAPGGRAATRDLGGYRFNVGPHALYLGGVAIETLGMLGIDPPGAPPAKTGSCFVLTGQLYPMLTPADGPGSDLLDDGEKGELGRAFQAVGAGFKGDPGDTVSEALRRLTPSSRVRELIAAQLRVATYSNAPETADAAAVFDQLRLAFSGVRYLDGGWYEMVRALAAAARSAGTEIRSGARALAVARDGAGWEVRLGGDSSLRAGAVIVAADPRQVRELTGLPLAEPLAPARAASLDVGLSHLPQQDRTFALGIDEPTYFSVHSASAHGLAPEGGALLHVARYLAPGEHGSATVRAQLEGLLDLLQPGWRDVVARVQWLPQVNVVHDQPQAALGGLAGRTPVATAEPGLYLAGDWVGDEGMLADAAFASGRKAGTLAAAAATSRRPA